MSLRKIARNKNRDRVYELFESFAHRVTSEHWSVYALQNSYESLLRGEKANGRLTTYSLLKPSIFDQFGSTIIASACFEDTMLYRLWTAWGVPMEPVTGKLAKGLRYQQHENGHLIQIAYVSDEDWSKSLRDRVVEVDGSPTRVLDRLVPLIGDATGGEPFAWMGNKDLRADIFDHLPGAVRLPNSPHGLNQFQHLHQVVVLSALNPPPAHFAFMATESINGEELRTSHYRTAVYQAVMRISIRNPESDDPKLVVVMDRATAEWLAGLFPGAEVVPLEGLGVRLSKGMPGRPRLYENSAQRKRAHRIRQQEQWYADLAGINGFGVEPKTYSQFIGEVEAALASTESRDKNTSIRTFRPANFGSAFADKYASRPIADLDLDDEEEFIRLLRLLHKEVPAAKEDNVLLSPAHFDPDMATETCRGLSNITHVRGIWMDNDGGDLTPDEFARLFPYLRLVVWNTYSSTPENLRWRVFIPTDYAMSIEVHRCVMAQIEKVLKDAGYRSDRDIEKLKGRSAKAWRRHGFDVGKFNAASLFYAPCQAAHPQDSFFIDYMIDRNEPKRGPLDLYQWIDHCILDLRPDPEPVAVPTTSTPTIPQPQVAASDSLRALRDRLVQMREKGSAQQRQEKIDRAVEEWRCTPKGDGHAAFFKLAKALQRAGLDETDIQQKLREEASFAHSPRDRRAEIRDIMRSLRKMGRL